MCGVKGSKGARASSGTAAAIVAFVSLLLAASVLAFFLSPPPPRADGKGAPPEPVELAIAGAGHEGYGWLDLGALRAWARLACLRLRRPLQPRGELRSPGESVVTKAAKKSLEMGKETVEHTAESAADTLGRTTEKVRRKVSSSPALGADGDL